jgi:hypothetical protein
MLPVMVVVAAPPRDQVADMAQAGEQVLFEALVPQAAVEDLDLEPANATGSGEPATVLHASALRNDLPFDFPVQLPPQDRVLGQVRAPLPLCSNRWRLNVSFTDHHAGIAPHSGDLVQFPRHTMAGDRCVDESTEALPAEVVDDAQQPGTTDPRPDCQRSSHGNATGLRDQGEIPRTIAGSFAAGSPSAHGSKEPACTRQACTPRCLARSVAAPH